MDSGQADAMAVLNYLTQLFLPAVARTQMLSWGQWKDHIGIKLFLVILLKLLYNKEHILAFTLQRGGKNSGLKISHLLYKNVHVIPALWEAEVGG